MTQLFYCSGAIALLASLLVITSKNAVHAAVHLVVSLLGVACVFFSLGSTFVAALEVIVYAGGIMVLILFVIMLLQIAKNEKRSQSAWLTNQNLGRARRVGAGDVIPAGVGRTGITTSVAACKRGSAQTNLDDVIWTLFAGGRTQFVTPLGWLGWRVSSCRRSQTSGKSTMSAEIPLNHGLFLAFGLFSIGLVGLLVRRNLLFVIMSLEIMLNAAGVAWIVSAARWQQSEGQIMFLFILAVAACEVAIALALAIKIRSRYKTTDTDALREMRW